MIDILLPVYNGGRYLQEQLDSIINQTYDDWRLIARDDGSTDNSMDIIRDYQTKYPGKFVVLEDSLGNQGASGCNHLLLQAVTSDYFMYCDQDDIWEKDKIEVTMGEMQKMEQSYPQLPILVCSDACCIDEDGEVLYPSFFENQKFIDVTDNVYKILALNVVQGSTALMNRAVKETIRFIPKNLYHDWWTAVNVVYYGKVVYIHKQLLRYRQHTRNVVGALDVGIAYHLKKLSHAKTQMHIYSTMYRQLSFKPSIWLWIYYKIAINIRRI